MALNNKRWNSIKGKDSVSNAADRGSTVTRGYIIASKGKSLCASITWPPRRTKVVTVHGFSLHAEVRQLPWMNETEKLKDESNVPASPFSRSVKALNWFWSSETKFGTRLKICNACFAVFRAHKAHLPQLRQFVKFLTTSDLQHIAVSVSEAGEVGAMRKMPQAPSSSYRKVIGRFQNVPKKKVLKWHPGKISRGHSALHAAAGCLQSTRQGPRGQLTSLCSSKWILPRHRRDPGMA